MNSMPTTGKNFGRQIYLWRLSVDFRRSVYNICSTAYRSPKANTHTKMTHTRTQIISICKHLPERTRLWLVRAAAQSYASNVNYVCMFCVRLSRRIVAVVVGGAHWTCLLGKFYDLTLFGGVGGNVVCVTPGTTGVVLNTNNSNHKLDLFDYFILYLALSPAMLIACVRPKARQQTLSRFKVYVCVCVVARLQTTNEIAAAVKNATRLFGPVDISRSRQTALPARFRQKGLATNEREKIILIDWHNEAAVNKAYTIFEIDINAIECATEPGTLYGEWESTRRTRRTSETQTSRANQISFKLI